MDWQDALSDIIIHPNSRLRFKEPLAKHTYFGIGGEATAYIEVSTIDELSALAHFHRQWDVPIAIIGRGSNLLVSDTGFKGISVRLIGELAKSEVDGNTVSVGAGLSLPRLSKTMSRQGLRGVEFALGITGSVGGA
ncbi:MAG: FAD-binding protein, partial [Candidatus Poribacteria bacterium]|nr:FAD-binding protein [Candidatus Poribacteria bacterium]